MATIYQKTSADRCLILDPREALLYPFDLGAGWAELRLGMFFSFADATDPNAAPQKELLTTDAAFEAFWFGLKDREQSLPGAAGAGAYFAGATAVPGASFQTTLERAGAYSAVTSYQGSTGCVRMSATGASPQDVLNTSLCATADDPAGATGFYGAAGLRLVAGDSVSLAHGGTQGDTPTVEALRSWLRTTPFSGGPSVSLPAPPAVPLAFFAYLPFLHARLRLHAIAVERYA